MELIAHRGFADCHPENTLRAFRAAAGVADWIELDARRCGSGEVVVFHDERLDRLTEASGTVAETPFERLRDLSVLGSGETVSRLTDVFEVVPASVGVNVELKERGLAADALAVADGYDHDLLVSSFDTAALREAREVDAGLALAAIGEDADGLVDAARHHDCEFVHPQYEACLDTDLVARAHDAGLAVNAWTVTTREVARALDAAGVDGVIADSPVVDVGD